MTLLRDPVTQTQKRHERTTTPYRLTLLREGYRPLEHVEGFSWVVDRAIPTVGGDRGIRGRFVGGSRFSHNVLNNRVIVRFREVHKVSLINFQTFNDWVIIIAYTFSA